MFRRLIRKFSVFHLIIIALMATLGIATKPIIVPLVHIITGPLYIPGGAIAGGLYMIWIVLGVGLINKIGVASIIAAVQAIMVVSLGMSGSHGIMSFLTYIVPGLAVDVLLILIKYRSPSLGNLFLCGLVANLSGTFLVNVIFFRLPIIPLILVLSSAALSGGVGGIIAYTIINKLEQQGILTNLMSRGDVVGQ
ncbi:MAG TPA: ECF transporter S component [Clostridia bacterium]|nr:ECF transporter S component [Clostridia bacterium]